MNIIECVQGSTEWKAARMGKVTASKLADVIDFTKAGKEGASRRNYRAQIVAELLTGQPQDDVFVTRAMQWGTDTEPLARVAYEIEKSVTVDHVGMVIHPAIDRSGASPDGLVTEDGLVEIKCPNTSTHLETILSDEIPEKYKLQMGWQLACTGRLWCDFVSYDPRLPEHLELYIKRFHRAEANIPALESAVRIFLGEVDEVLAILEGRKNS